ncbi:MAG: universal stress protein [Arachnia sp.]
MSIVIGISPAHETHEGVGLATLVARSTGLDVVVVAVVPEPWKGRALTVDRDYQDYLAEQAEETLTAARALFPPDVACRTAVRRAASASQGLLDAVREFSSPVLVLGSSSSSLLGRIGLGSVTERLLHSSPVPVAVAPHGYVAPSAERIDRVSIGFIGDADEASVVARAGTVAAQIGAAVRLVSFAVRPAQPVTSSIGTEAEDEIVDSWAAELADIGTELGDALSALPNPPSQEPPAFGRGVTWDEALAGVPWREHDVLVVGSSRTAGAIGVFLGGTASKIARHSPVPVVVVPRRRDETG